MRAPFPFFGGKSQIAADVWRAFGAVKQYIEPFCGSAAVLLAAPRPASLEVVGDANGFLANFWRATKHQPAAVAEWADYPVSHVDLGARHVWLMEQRMRLSAELQDPDWPGDAKVAGWWLWGQCAWIGSGWCDWLGKVPHASDAGRGLLTSAGAVAWRWLHELAARLERVRIVHGDWDRCLNNHYGGTSTAVFLDPPYRGFREVYSNGGECVADRCQAWAADNAHLRVALCGHRGDYDLPGWAVHEWSRGKFTYSGSKTTDLEAVWFSPACEPARAQAELFGRNVSDIAEAAVS